MSQLLALEWNSHEIRVAVACARGSRIVVEHAFLLPWNEDDSGAASVKGDSPIFADTKIGTVPDRAIDEIIGRWIDSTGKQSSETIACRLVLPMLLEATRILEEGKVGDPRDIDLAVLFGLGFPADKGGLLWWADALGPQRILGMLSSPRTIEDRNRPTPMLETLAKTDGRFYPSLSRQSP